MKNLINVLLFACLSAVFASCAKTDISPAAPELTHNIAGNPAKDIASPIVPIPPTLENIEAGGTITGDWTIAADSSFATGIGATTTGTGTNYVGQAGDYFKITTDGRVYIKKGTQLDTANYTVTPDKKIVLNYTFYGGAPVTNYGSIAVAFNQLGLTAQTLTLTSSVITPGSSLFRTITLRK